MSNQQNMNREIERKFLVLLEKFPKNLHYELFRQGYLSTKKERTVRVRLAGDKGFLTIKGITKGVSRSEYEYEIPKDDAINLIETLCQKPLIEKKRYKIEHIGHTWEVDEFLGENKGLWIAEIELNAEDEKFETPDWLGDEVSHDSRYFNSSLISNPFSRW
jgi:adenylate cyclase